MNKAVHQQTTHTGPVFCKGRWLQFIFEDSHWANLVRYIESHNVRRELPARPYEFLRAETADNIRGFLRHCSIFAP
jgi:hypothetical protein